MCKIQHFSDHKDLGLSFNSHHKITPIDKLKPWTPLSAQDGLPTKKPSQTHKEEAVKPIVKWLPTQREKNPLLTFTQRGLLEILFQKWGIRKVKELGLSNKWGCPNSLTFLMSHFLKWISNSSLSLCGRLFNCWFFNFYFSLWFEKALLWATHLGHLVEFSLSMSIGVTLWCGLKLSPKSLWSLRFCILHILEFLV